MLTVDTYTVEDEIYLSPYILEGYEFEGWYNLFGMKVEKIPKGTIGHQTVYAQMTKIN